LTTSRFQFIGYRVLGDFPSKHFPLSETVKRSLRRAGLRVNHIVYISAMTFWAIFATVIAAPAAFPITFTLNQLLYLNMPTLQLILIPIGAAAGAGVLVLVGFLGYPEYIAGNIKTGIEKNIIYIINYMAILVGAGVTNEDVFASLAKTGRTYGVEESAKSIVRDIELLGRDIIAAIGEESRNMPSRKYSKILEGLIGVIRTGGDLKEYLKELTEHHIEIRKRELQGLVSRLNLIAEAYIILGIAFPVILTTLLSMMGIFGGEVMAGLGPVQMMMLVTYLMFPLASIGIIVLLDGMVGSW
jgi:flagellar protein FlaJ